jgi:hypothetical protein
MRLHRRRHTPGYDHSRNLTTPLLLLEQRHRQRLPLLGIVTQTTQQISTLRVRHLAIDQSL